MAEKNGGELVVEALEKNGVEVVFGLSGGHIFPIEEGLERSSIRYITTRHEQAAVFMAEAYGRMQRKAGIALVTAGPGFTNTLSAVQNASMGNVPLLLIAGAVGLKSREKIDLQDVSQLPVIQPMVKKAFICHNTERIAEFMDMALRTATYGRPGPVYLEIPVDIIGGKVAEESIKKPWTITSSRSVDREAVTTFLQMLNKSEKPIIIAGSGAHYSGAGSAITTFAEKTGAPIFTTTQGRGVISDTHPLCYESSLFVRPGAAPVALTESDLVVLLGNRISLLYAFGDIINPNAKLIQIDIETEEIGRNRSIDLGVLSDIKAFITECNNRLEDETNNADLVTHFEDWREALNKAADEQKAAADVNWMGENDCIHPWRLAKEIDLFMDREDDIIAADGGDMQTWMSLRRTCRRSGHYLETGLFGCLGVGLPYGNAAKVLNPDKRVLTIIGDGSMGFNFMEVETAIRHNIPLVIVIGNDGGWGMVRHAQQLKLGHIIEECAEIGKINYQNLVKELGGESFYVDKADEIRPTLEKAFATGKVACINVITDPAPISPGSMALAQIGGYTPE